MEYYAIHLLHLHCLPEANVQQHPPIERSIPGLSEMEQDIQSYLYDFIFYYIQV